MSRVDPDTLREIATLSAAINRHKLGLPPASHTRGRGSSSSSSSSTRGYAPHYGGHNAHAYNQRGRGRGSGQARGRGGHAYPARPAQSVHRKLILNNSNDGTSTNKSTTETIRTPSSVNAAVQASGAGQSAQMRDDASTSTASSIPTQQQGDDALVKVEEDEKEEGEIPDEPTARPTAEAAKALQYSRPASQRRSRHRTLVLNGAKDKDKASQPAATAVSPQAGKEIVINGVTFVGDASGRKLVRKDAPVSTISAGSKAASTSSAADRATNTTPIKTLVGGQSYVRTKSGNLISAELVKKRELDAKRKRLGAMVGILKNVQTARSSRPTATSTNRSPAKPKTLCRYFQKTGKCTRGLTCPYIHDSNKVAICPRYLKKSCPYPSDSCPLSHEPNPHRMPQCQHFPYCNQGASCPYSHVHVAPDAKVCKDFVTLGWCEKGLECKERHVWECPEFSESGVCNKRGCKLPHVIRRKVGAVKDSVGSGNTAALVSAGSASTGEAATVVVVAHDDPMIGLAGSRRDATLKAPSDASASRTRKRSRDIATQEDPDDEATAEATPAALSEDRKRARTVDAVEANEDFVTLVLSESDEQEDDDDVEEEEEEDETIQEVNDSDGREEEEEAEEADSDEVEGEDPDDISSDDDIQSEHDEEIPEGRALSTDSDAGDAAFEDDNESRSESAGASSGQYELQAGDDGSFASDQDDDDDDDETLAAALLAKK